MTYLGRAALSLIFLSLAAVFSEGAFAVGWQGTCTDPTTAGARCNTCEVHTASFASAASGMIFNCMRMTSGEEEVGKLLAYVTVTASTPTPPASLPTPWECSVNFSIDTGRDKGGMLLKTTSDAPTQTGTSGPWSIAADSQGPVSMRVVPVAGHFNRKDGCPIVVDIILTRGQ